MLTTGQESELQSIFQKVECPFDISKFKSSLAVLRKRFDFKEIFSKIELLVNLVTKLTDCEAQRSAYSMLRHISDVNVLHCVLDEPFGEEISDNFDKIQYCLYSSLVGSKKVSESLFNASLNPKSNSYVISYAMCSGDIDWVQKLVQTWNVNIKQKKYCFQFYAESLKSAELKNYFHNFDEKKPPVAFKSDFFSKKLPHEIFHEDLIKRELLESFTEILLGEFDELMDMGDHEVRRLLVDILFDSNITVEKVIKYAAELLSPVAGPRVGIIHCCIFPEKWDDSSMKDYCSAMIHSYIKHLGCTPEDEGYKKKCDALKTYASTIWKKFSEEMNIELIKRDFSVSDQAKKQETLKRISKDIVEYVDVSSDASSLFQDVETSYKLICEEGGTGVFKDINERKGIFARTPSPGRLPNTPDVWKLSLSDKKWPRIYELVKETNTGRLRDPRFMLKIVSAVLYKEEKHCSWRELPQLMPPATTVRHYYYQWKNENKLEQIRKIAFSSSFAEKSSKMLNQS